MPAGTDAVERAVRTRALGSSALFREPLAPVEFIFATNESARHGNLWVGISNVEKIGNTRQKPSQGEFVLAQITATFEWQMTVDRHKSRDEARQLAAALRASLVRSDSTWPIVCSVPVWRSETITPMSEHGWLMVAQTFQTTYYLSME